MARRRSRHTARPYWWFGKQDHLAEAPDREDQVGWPPEGPTPEELDQDRLADARWRKTQGGGAKNRVF